MIKRGTLEFRTVGTGENRAKVVLLPGHEFPIEHFFPPNQTHVLHYSRRVRLVQSNLPPQPKFYAKRSVTPIDYDTWTIAAQARLAKYVNGLRIEGVNIEEPLATVFRKPGIVETMYREIQAASFFKRLWLTGEQRHLYDHFIETLKREGIEPFDHSVGVDEKGIIHVIDLEDWGVKPELAKKLGLKKQ
ncbi:MAG: hypothetical protein V1644_01855 [Candidatus Micrarchaeota archaeon]